MPMRILLLFVILSATAAQAQTRLAVDVGWGGVAKAGRWCPVFVTVSGSAAREVSLEIVSPHDDRSSTHLRQLAAVGQAATTYAMFVPAAQRLEATAVRVCDATTGATLAADVLSNRPAKSPPLKLLAPGDLFIGISGRAEPTRLVQARLGAGGIANGILAPDLLPTVPLGYDALDLLLLSAPDLGALGVEQQQAIVAWVERGGVLLISPSAEPLPRASAILNVLPCKLGDNRTYAPSPPQITAAGLQPSAGPLDGRVLHPAAFAENIELFGSGSSGGIPPALGRQLGFGRVVVVPADLGQLRFVDDFHAGAFWRRVIPLILQDVPPAPSAPPAAVASRESAAIQQAIDTVGPPPGPHGFLSLAIVFAGLSAVVGPVDWVVLKALGRRPWTWTTSLGWLAVACVIVADVAAQRQPPATSGDAVRVIDQADDQTLATTEVASADKAAAGGNPSWQQPAGDPLSAVVGRGLRADERFRQDRRGTQFESIVAGDEPPLVRAQRVEPGPPVLDASLSVRDGRLVGTITNRGQEKLTDILVRTGTGAAAIPGDVGAGGSTTVAGDPAMACVDARVGDERTLVRALVRLNASK